MFGSLRIARNRLDSTEQELYRGHFCGSCHALREFGGRLSAVLTNYDQTVLALVLGGLENSATDWRRCTAVPFRWVPVAALSAGARRYLAALNLVLVQAKLRDDVADGDRRLLAGAALRVLRRPAGRANRALRDLGFPIQEVTGLPQQQARVEARGAVTLESLAAPSAALTGAVFAGAAVVTGRPQYADPLRAFGRALGAFVYAWDAWVDRDADRRKGRFNAIDAVYGSRAGRAEVHLFLRRHWQRLQAGLAGVPLGRQGGILAAMLASMGQRLSCRVAERPAEAGDCDCSGCDGCGCDGCSCDGCGGASGESEACGCCSGPKRAVSGCDCCEVCDCCLSRDARSQRRRDRRGVKPSVGEAGADTAPDRD